jgi:putative alpha-1,2-mannosidase
MIGNDDCGQMSAWYILSSLGFYPVNPANNEFILGAPQLKKARLNLKNGKVFEVKANNISIQNIYSDKALLNGKMLDKPFITFEQILNGGNLDFEMGEK